MKAWIFQHESFEGPFAVLDWLEENGFEVNFTHLYRNESLPKQDEVDWLILMGGPMSVNDEKELPWLAEEKKFIKNCIEAGKKVVGVCLGSQLIASSLGCKVYPGKNKEIGWFPITREGNHSSLPTKIKVFHWHGETFDLPVGATLIASSKACNNQIFLYGDNVLAMQCHLEMTPEAIAGMFDNCSDEIVHAPYIQTIDDMIAGTQKNATKANKVLFSLLNSLREKHSK
jgi:GMP synthase-like glutamine amidotransferase